MPVYNKTIDDIAKKAIEQFFFLHYPTSQKNADGKYVTRTNAEDRQQIVKRNT